MPLRIFLFIISILCLLFPETLFSAVPSDQSPTHSLQMPQKTILQSHVTLEESINNLSKIFNVKIEIAGPFSVPSIKFDLNMNHATLEEAVKEAIRKAGVQNHALVWDKTGKTLRLLTFESGKKTIVKDVYYQNTSDRDLFKYDVEPLTQEQIYLLAQQDNGLANAIEPLTPDQIERLKDESSRMEVEAKKGASPLEAEQIERLKAQSSDMKAEMEEKMKPLTAEQMNQLKKQSPENENQEVESVPEPLTKEQILLLQDMEINNDATIK